MLVQEGKGKIHLLPAWPAAWDADFKLHLEGNTVVSGTVVDGKLTDWSVEPASRKKDVVVYEPQDTDFGEPSGSSGAAPAKIPVSKHPLRIGRSSSGGSGLRGVVGRATLLRGMLKPEAIRELAAGDRTEVVSGDTVVTSVLNPKNGDILPTEPADFSGEITLEAWLKPGKGEAGRIFDMLTAGKRDGFLVDCWPGLSLRVIVGPYQKDHVKVLKPNVWQHVAVTIGNGKVAVYLDGKKL
jgi:hypothetical protein